MVSNNLISVYSLALTAISLAASITCRNSSSFLQTILMRSMFLT